MFMQVRALEGVKPSAQPTLVRTQHLPLALVFHGVRELTARQQ